YGIAARLLQEESAEVVEVLLAVAQLLDHGRALDLEGRAEKHSARLSGGMDVDRLDDLPVCHTSSLPRLISRRPRRRHRAAGRAVRRRTPRPAAGSANGSDRRRLRRVSFLP